MNQRAIATILGSILLTGGCAGLNEMLPGVRTSVVESAATTRKYQPDLPPNTSGLLASVRVAGFVFDQDSGKAGEFRWLDQDGKEASFQWNVGRQHATGQAMADLLESTLSASGYYLVNVRGETFAATVEEKGLSDDGWVGTNAVEKGRMQSPDLMVKATVIEWAPNVKGGGGAAGALVGNLLGGARWENQVSRVALQLQVVDTERQQIVVPAIPVEVISKSSKITGGALAGLPGAVVGGALNSYANTSMEEAIALAVKTSVEKITQSLPPRYYRHRW